MQKIHACKKYSIFKHTPQEPIENIIFVCFDEIDGGLNKKGFGVDFLNKNNIETIFVSHAHKSFFQGLNENALYEHLSSHIKDKKVFTYGASLGGYAALYYSDVLNARPIAFSPRCSIDPVYENSHRFNIEFTHTPLNQKKPTNNIKPVVIIDFNEKLDKVFYDLRVSKFFEEIDLVELPNGSHHTARALQSQGLLKDFVLNIIENDTVELNGFNAYENCISLSNMALKAVRKKQYNDANDFLERITHINKQPDDLFRIQAYLILIKNGKLSHKFDRKKIFPSERKIIHNQLYKQIKNNDNSASMLMSIANAELKLLNFKNAYQKALEVNSLYPQFQSKSSELIKKIELMIKNSEGYID